jgi:hypothetical protein
MAQKVKASRLHFLLCACEALCLREDGLRSFAAELGVKMSAVTKFGQNVSP